MQEDYLHLVWRHKRLPVHRLFLTNGLQLHILDFGIYNRDAGPDFFNGKIEIEGIIWVGNIEFHVKASDWYKHEHHLDRAYDNTILHVVHENDMEISVDDRIIPTLELKSYIDFKHWQKYRSLLLQQQWIPCENMIGKVSNQSRTAQIELALQQRLNKKSAFLAEELQFYNGDLLSVYYSIYAKAFGLKVNELPFLELSSRIPLALLWRLPSNELRLILLGCAGFFQNPKRFGLEEDVNNWEFLKSKYQLDEMVFHSWKFKGLRPPSFPDKRIPEFGSFCQNQEFFRLHELESSEILDLLSKHFKAGGMMKKHILINAIVPLLWWYAEANNRMELRKKALELLKSVGAESNSIVDRWKKLGFRAKTSFDSQGLLELKNEFCTNKKCLSCTIGFELLKV